MKIRYYTDQDTFWELSELPIAEFLIETSLVVSSFDKLVPPDIVLSEYLAKGKQDLGMGGGYRWSGFSPSLKQLHDVVASLESMGYKRPVDADWVRTIDDWMIYLTNRTLGVPIKEQLDFRRKITDLIKSKQKLIDEGNFDAAEQINLTIIKVKLEESAFLSQYS